MIIRTEARDIRVKNVVGDHIMKGAVRCRALRLELPAGITDEDITALTGGAFEIVDNEGNALGTHEGYTTLKSINVVLEETLSTAEEEIVALSEELESARAESEAAKQRVKELEAEKDSVTSAEALDIIMNGVVE